MGWARYTLDVFFTNAPGHPGSNHVLLKKRGANFVLQLCCFSIAGSNTAQWILDFLGLILITRPRQLPNVLESILCISFYRIMYKIGQIQKIINIGYICYLMPPKQMF
jgi:hypothetical protein